MISRSTHWSVKMNTVYTSKQRFLRKFQEFLAFKGLVDLQKFLEKGFSEEKSEKNEIFQKKGGWRYSLTWHAFQILSRLTCKKWEEFLGQNWLKQFQSVPFVTQKMSLQLYIIQDVKYVLSFRNCNGDITSCSIIMIRIFF